MPNFLSWHKDEQTNQFGALVQLNSRTFKPQLDGTIQVLSTPSTDFFSGEKMDKLAQLSTGPEKTFWENMQQGFQRQLPVWENSQDITASVGKPAAPEPGMAPVFIPALA